MKRRGRGRRAHADTWLDGGRAAPRGGRRDAGSALVESLVALVLVALAGALVAAAARSGLRAAARAATLTRTSTLAGRELARLAANAASATSGEATLALPGFPDPATCSAEVAHDDDVVALAVDVVAGRPAERVTLATRRFVAPPPGR